MSKNWIKSIHLTSVENISKPMVLLDRIIKLDVIEFVGIFCQNNLGSDDSTYGDKCSFIQFQGNLRMDFGSLCVYWRRMNVLPSLTFSQRSYFSANCFFQLCKVVGIIRCTWVWSNPLENAIDSIIWITDRLFFTIWLFLSFLLSSYFGDKSLWLFQFTSFAGIVFFLTSNIILDLYSYNWCEYILLFQSV